MSAVKTIGIIGGGQLGLMIIEQAHLLGARTICLDPAEDAPAFKISDERIVGRFDDPAALEELCRRSDVVTYEFENVPGDLLVALEQKYNIKQGFRPLFDSQDRLREKSNACDHGLKTPVYPKTGFDFKAFYTALKSKGFVIYPGKISKADTFRIGNIGDVHPEDFARLVEVVRETEY